MRCNDQGVPAMTVPLAGRAEPPSVLRTPVTRTRQSHAADLQKHRHGAPTREGMQPRSKAGGWFAALTELLQLRCEVSGVHVELHGALEHVVQHGDDDLEVRQAKPMLRDEFLDLRELESATEDVLCDITRSDLDPH